MFLIFQRGGPFLPPTDAYKMRPYAASMIIFGLLPAMGLLFGMETLKLRFLHKPEAEDAKESSTIAFTSLLVLVMIIGSLMVKVLATHLNLAMAPVNRVLT
jgi:hypothetical protein